MPIEGSLAMVPALERLRNTKSCSHQTGEIYQTSLMSALFQGVYDGEVTYGSLREHGDFGVGTFNELDGEMVAFDGQFYQLRSDGTVRPVDPEQKTPFAVVTFFEPTIERDITSPMTKAQVEMLIGDLTTANLFYAVRIDGLFASVSTRTVRRQEKPYVPLASDVAKEAPNGFSEVYGTLAGFRSPAYAETITGPEYHLHFVGDDRLVGGHALDFVLAHGRISIAPQHGLHIELPSTLEFGDAKLNDASLADAIRGSEG